MCSKLYTMMRVIITTSDAAPYAIGGTLLLRYKLPSRPSSYLYRHVISERGYALLISVQTCHLREGICPPRICTDMSSQRGDMPFSYLYRHVISERGYALLVSVQTCHLREGIWLCNRQLIKESFSFKTRMAGTVKCRPTVAY